MLHSAMRHTLPLKTLNLCAVTAGGAAVGGW